MFSTRKATEEKQMFIIRTAIITHDILSVSWTNRAKERESENNWTYYCSCEIAGRFKCRSMEVRVLSLPWLELKTKDREAWRWAAVVPDGCCCRRRNKMRCFSIFVSAILRLRKTAWHWRRRSFTCIKRWLPVNVSSKWSRKLYRLVRCLNISSNCCRRLLFNGRCDSSWAFSMQNHQVHLWPETIGQFTRAKE